MRCWSWSPIFCLLAGCFTTAPDQGASAWTKHLRPQLPPDVAIIEFALVERPLGDRYLNHELWKHTDEMFVDLEKKATLEANGLRVGQVVGMTPAELQEMLRSERWCQNPHRQIAPVGKTITEPLSQVVIPHCEYDLFLNGERHELQADQARFALDVTAVLTAHGKTKLTFTPKVETGERVLPFQPDPNNSTWLFKPERPAKAYRELGWQATLAPNEYLVVGPRIDKPGTLGYEALVQDEGAGPTQRLLVIRTNRSLHNGPGDEASLEAIASAGASPPLAAQASMTTFRASRP